MSVIIDKQILWHVICLFCRHLSESQPHWVLLLILIDRSHSCHTAGNIARKCPIVKRAEAIMPGKRESFKGREINSGRRFVVIERPWTAWFSQWKGWIDVLISGKLYLCMCLCINVHERESVCLCMPASAPAGLPVHTYACSCGFLYCVRVCSHTPSLWRDKEERSSQSTDGLKWKAMLRERCVCVCDK